jgi:hypothetical protein
MSRLEVLSNDRAALVIEREGSSDLRWRVTLRGSRLSGSGVSATAPVYADGEGLLVAFFDDLARDWRGWSDARTWQSIEGTLQISARHDGLGHIALRVTLTESLDPDAWSLEVTLKVDAGALAGIARDVANFSGA